MTRTLQRHGNSVALVFDNGTAVGQHRSISLPLPWSVVDSGSSESGNPAEVVRRKWWSDEELRIEADRFTKDPGKPGGGRYVETL